MNTTNKRDLILDAMQELMTEGKTNTSTVSDIAQKAGIGKGSIYYYFASKHEIIEGVIERSYSRVLEKGRIMAESTEFTVYEKLAVIFHSCLAAAKELKRQESFDSLYEKQQSALVHQHFANIIITRLHPILTEILAQGTKEGIFLCDSPKELSHIILLVLTMVLDNHPVSLDTDEQFKVISYFFEMQESVMGIKKGTLARILLPETKDSFSTLI